jgi:hypothetical protein
MRAALALTAVLLACADRRRAGSETLRLTIDGRQRRLLVVAPEAPTAHPATTDCRPWTLG